MSKRPPVTGGVPLGGNTPPGGSPSSNPLEKASFRDSAAGWAYGFLKFIGAAPPETTVAGVERDNRVMFLMAWMQKEGIFTIGNPYNPLAIEYSGAVTQEKKRWNPQGVSMFSSRTKGYEALQDFINGYGKGPFAIYTALKQGNINLKGLQSALAATDWPGGGAAAGAAYAASVMSDLPGDAQYQAQQESGNFIGSGNIGPTSSTALPKHNTSVYTDKYGNEAIKSPSPSSVLTAYERVQNALHMWGLDDKQLVQMAYQRAVAGEDYNQIIADIRKTPQYAAQFPGMAFRQKAGLPLISESQYISYERSMMGLASKYALPKGFISKHEVGELIAHNVSPVEFGQRLQGLSTLVTQANPLVKREFEKYFGVRGANGALAAYWANPNKATMILNEQLHAAEFGAQTRESGLGALNKGQAMELAHFEYLHTPGTVANEIDKASEFANLRGSAPGSNIHPLSGETILASAIPGLGQPLAEAQATVRRNAMARAGAVQKGGGLAANPKGLSAGGATTEGVGGPAQ